MFWSASKFNQSLSAWDVSRVTTMDYSKCVSACVACLARALTFFLVAHTVFLSASKFNQDVSAWNVSRVTTMESSKCMSASVACLANRALTFLFGGAHSV